MKKNFGVFNLLLIFLIFIFFDYVSKLWAIENLFMQYRSIELTSFLSMTPVWNSGISFGFFQDSGELGRYGFTGFSFGISIWLIYSSIKLPRYSSLGFILIASGAIGNAIDRILYGKVVDFIDFHFDGFHWFIFNVADIFITLGVIIMIMTEFFVKKESINE